MKYGISVLQKKISYQQNNGYIKIEFLLDTLQ